MCKSFMFTNAAHIAGALRGQEKVLDPLELRVTGRHKLPYGAGNQIQFLC